MVTHAKINHKLLSKQAYASRTVGTLTRDINVVDGTIILQNLAPEFEYIKLQNFRGPHGDEETFWEHYGKSPKLIPYVTQFVCRAKSGPASQICTQNHMYVCKPPGLGSSGKASTRVSVFSIDRRIRCVPNPQK